MTMMQKYLALLIIGLLGCASVLAQTKAEERNLAVLRSTVLKQEALIVKDESGNPIFSLPEGQYSSLTTDIDTGYYRSERRYGKLAKLEAEGKLTNTPDAYLVELEDEIEDYVQRFRIRNFTTDVNLLWMTGRVNHLLGDTSQAIFFYELAKVHDHGDRIPRLSLDSLLAPTASEWLPIDQYYELLELRMKIDSLIPPVKVLTSMGKAINSKDPDYAPFMHRQDSVLIFTSRRDTSGMIADQVVDPYHRQNEDIYYTSVDFITGDWLPAERLSDTINSEYNEGSACLAPDGNTLYFTRCHPRYGQGGCDIYQATYDAVSDSWGNVINLGENINSKAWDSQPNISGDGEKLFFVSNRKGGFGGTDIFVSFRDDEGKWGPAQNLGPLINTPNHEVTPFFHEINNTIYFSSTGHLTNFGGYDIFKARQLKNSWEHPKNVGPLVNTNKNEYYFSIDGGASTIFYAKNIDEGDVEHVEQNFDLYSFPMPMEARPDAVIKLRGTLIDSVTGYPLVGKAMLISLTDSIEITPKEIKDGYFEFDVIPDKKYRLYIIGDAYLTNFRDMYIRSDTSIKVITRSFENNKPIVFESLRFASRSSNLKSGVKPKLDYIVQFLQTYKQFKLEIEGHTDSDGRPESNLALSKQRADKIREYLIKRGDFGEDRILATGYGETRPLVPNSNDSLKAINRRVEFKLVLDQDYEGETINPTAEELFFKDDLEEPKFDPDFKDDFEWSDEELEAWEKEIEIEEEMDLESELEAEIFKSLEKELDKKVSTPK